MYIRILTSLLFVLLVVNVNAQREANNWYFGVKAGITFNSGRPQPLFNSEMSAGEGCSSISDRNGNLLFYSDGYFIWNRQHQRMMDNGTFSIIGDNADGTQTGVIVPWPDHDSLYFVFSVGQLGGNLYYSIVDMSRNNGLGEVVTKKVLLVNEVCEKLTAIRHCNKHDFWIVIHRFNSDEYSSYLVNGTGVETTPVVSATGNSIVNSSGMDFTKAMGYLKNSPDGRMLAAAHFLSDFVELTDFNASTGKITNPRKINAAPASVSPPFDGAYGIEFSADSRVLYVSSYYGPPQNDTTTIYQFDLTAGSGALIQASRQFIYGSNWSHNNVTALQLGPDKKIYVAKYGYSLSVINHPEVLGNGCQFVSDAIYIDDGSGAHHCDFGLPNFIQSFFNDPIIASGNCQFSNISFSLGNVVGINAVHWNFGDPSSGLDNQSTLLAPKHFFRDQGQYKVTAILINSNGCGFDTITKVIHAGKFKVSLGKDTTICETHSLKLHQAVPNGINLWSNNSQDTIIQIDKSGQYWVQVQLGDCIASDTVSVLTKPIPAFTLGNDTVGCSADNIVLSPHPNPANVSYSWSTGDTTTSLQVSLPGDYWLRIKENITGCEFQDTVNVSFRQLANFSLGEDTAICEGANFHLEVPSIGAESYLWNTGATSQSIEVDHADLYWVNVVKDKCLFRDSVLITIKESPKVDLGMDTIICNNASLILHAGNTAAQYLWQDNTTSEQLQVSSPGNYYVKVTNSFGCAAVDTIKVQHRTTPVFDLGVDFNLCEGQIAKLEPSLQDTTELAYLWQDGSSESFFTVIKPGLYELSVSNFCGEKKDIVLVGEGICQLKIPTGFTPNGDGLNDIFRVKYGENVTQFNLEIYNRWGEKIYNTNSLHAGWDGSYRGTLQPNGTYIWLISYKLINDANTHLIKGTVTLIR